LYSAVALKRRNRG